METSGSCINASAEAAGTERERDIRGVVFTLLLRDERRERERDAKSERKEKRECTP